MNPPNNFTVEGLARKHCLRHSQDWENNECSCGAATAAIREALALNQLQADLIAQLPGRQCVRPDHNGADGRQYGYMCGGCAFELAQDEANVARREALEEAEKHSEVIQRKCEQYWNGPAPEEAELHAIMEFIHQEAARIAALRGTA